jgi:asparagine synthase (glutamine-hydrolysing)
MNGLIGGKDLRPGELERLGHFADAVGGKLLHPPEHFALWRIGTPRGGLREVARYGVHAWLLGDLFVPASPATQALPAEFPIDAYQHEGHGWIWPMTGQFALVLWDAGRQELALFRDDSSARSLYYHRLPSGALVFSDDLDLLVHCPLVPRRLSANGIHEYLRFLDISTPATIYDGVHSTEPGALCLHGRHGLHHRHPESMPSAVAEVASPRIGLTLDSAAAALDTRLGRAVESRIADAHGLVAFLSGGVDSAYLCALAARQSPQLTAVTVGFDVRAADESAVAGKIAAAIGVPHRVLRFSPAQYRRAFEALAGGPYPFADPAGPPTLLAFEHSRQLGDTALDGTGADTLLGIMPARHQRLAVQYVARLPYRLRWLLTTALAPVPWLRDYRPLLDFGDPQEVLVRWRGWSRREIERLCGRPVSLVHTRFYGIFRRFPRAAHMARYSALMGNLPDDRIHVAADLTGLRVRFPFFDPAVSAYVAGLPPTLRYAGGEHKRVLKHALARRLPRDLWDVPKHGFDFPFDALLDADGHALLHEHAAGGSLERLGCADLPGLRRCVDEYLAGDRRQRFRVWALVTLGAWLAAHDLAA